MPSKAEFYRQMAEQVGSVKDFSQIGLQALG